MNSQESNFGDDGVNTCLLCENSYKEKLCRPVNMIQKTTNICNKYLHATIIGDGLSPSSGIESTKICGQCLESALQLTALDNELETIQKSIRDLLFTFSEEIRNRRTNKYKQRSDQTKEFCVCLMSSNAIEEEPFIVSDMHLPEHSIFEVVKLENNAQIEAETDDSFCLVECNENMTGTEEVVQFNISNNFTNGVNSEHNTKCKRPRKRQMKIPELLQPQSSLTGNTVSALSEVDSREFRRRRRSDFKAEVPAGGKERSKTSGNGARPNVVMSASVEANMARILNKMQEDISAQGGGRARGGPNT